MTIRILGDQVFPQAIEDTSLVQLCPLGTTVLGVDDATNKQATYIYALGAASTAVGSVVGVDPQSFVASIQGAAAGSGGIPAVAMSANLANQYGFYKITEGASGTYFLTSSTLTMDSSFAGKEILVRATTGTTITLPLAVGGGNVYKFKIDELVTSNTIVIKVPNSAHSIWGQTLNTATENGAAKGFVTAGDTDTITLNGTTTGGFESGYYELTDDDVNSYQVLGRDLTSGTPATPFSATV